MNLGTILDAIKIWVEGLISTMGYPGLGITMFLENIFPLTPSEIVLPLAGSLTLTGRFTILGVVFFSMLGCWQAPIYSTASVNGGARIMCGNWLRKLESICWSQ